MRTATLLICCFSLIALNTSAKDKPLKNYEGKKLTVGYMAGTGQPLEGLQYTLPQPVAEVQSDSVQNLVLLLRKNPAAKSSLLSLNARTGTVNWEKPKSFHPMQFTRDLVLYTVDASIRVVNKHSGEYMHTFKQQLKFVDEPMNRGLTNTGAWLDLATNTELWKRKIRLEQRSPETEWLNDSTVLLASDGIHMLRLSDGRHWHYELKTTREDYTEAIVVGVLTGVLAGAVGGGVAAYSDGDHISGISSNILIDHNTGIIYYSGLKSTVALDTAGREVWKQENVRRETSKSVIWLEDGKLVRINLGYGFENGVSTQVGVPFIAAYDAATGKPIYKTDLGSRDFVSSYYSIGGKTLFKVWQDLMLFDHEIGKMLAEKQQDKKDEKNPMEVVDNRNYFFRDSDSSFYSLHDRNPDQFYVSDTRNIYRLQENLDLGDSKPLSQAWKYSLDYRDLLFVRNGNRVAILRDNLPLAFLTVDGSLAVVGEQVLMINDERLTVLPMSEILK